MIEKIKQHANKIIIVILCALLAAAAAGDFILFQKSNQLQAESRQKTKLIEVLNRKLSAATSEAESWKMKAGAVETQCSAETNTLKEQIAAFAKQAASCDLLKKKLHIK
jgi:flagellar basal body-associated protein FliL